METLEFEVSADRAGGRLDHFLCESAPHLSRSRIQSLIRSGDVLLNARPAAKPGETVRVHDRISLREPPRPPLRAEPEDIALDIIFEDGDIIVVNKPAGLVTHPAVGHAEGTLVNALLHHSAALSGGTGAERPGIVHRLDKDTSGLIVIAKNDAAHAALAAQFAERTMEKRYLALARGWPRVELGSIDAPIARHRHERKKMAVAADGHGRAALTTYRLLQRLKPSDIGLAASLLECRLHSGRTHQIRVHLKHLGHPILGDTLYGGPVSDVTPRPRRQMLHAWILAFTHPRTGEALRFVAPLPADFLAYLDHVPAPTS